MSEPWRGSMNKWLREHAGVIGCEKLAEFGCPRGTVQSLLDRKELLPLQHGVYRSSQWPSDDMQKMLAACVSNPHVAIGFLSAAKLWKFRRLPTFEGIHVLVPHSSSPKLNDVVVHRCRDVQPTDIVPRERGLRVTSPPRTLFDCADLLGVEATASVMEQLINDDHGTFLTHLSTFTRLARPRRPGTVTMGQVIASRPAWRAAMQSDLEARVLGEIERQLLPRPEVQYWFTLPSGQRIRLDFAWPQFEVGLEVDHPFWHAGAVESHRDKHRDRKMTAIGWRMARITDLDVEGGLASAIADVAGILQRAANQPSAR